MDHVTLILTPDPGTTPDLPFRAPRVDVALHPLARVVDVVAFQGMGFPLVTYRSRSDPVSYAIPAGMEDGFAWYQALFTRRGYTCSMSKGRSGNTRTGVFVEWMDLRVSPPENSCLMVQLSFRRASDEETVVTCRAEEHPIPLRDPDSLLSPAAERIEVRYTFLNGPERTIHRTVTDPAKIRALVETINSYPPDNRGVTHGTFWPGGWAELRFMAPGEPERKVHVDASHWRVIVDVFPALLGNPWSPLIQIAPPPRGASGVPGLDWEEALEQ